MTQDQKRRVIEAIAEAVRVLDRAKRGQEKFWDRELIAQYETHHAKLVGMLHGFSAASCGPRRHRAGVARSR